MRINGFRCDECAKEHLLDNAILARGTLDPPAGWLVVITCGSSNDPLLFCSDACLYIWSKNKLNKVSE